MSLFKGIEGLLSDKVTLQLTIEKLDEANMTVMVYPKYTNADDDVQKEIKPIVISGTAEELDANFVTVLSAATDISKEFESSIEEFKKSLEEAKKKATPVKKKTTTKSSKAADSKTAEKKEDVGLFSTDKKKAADKGAEVHEKLSEKVDKPKETVDKETGEVTSTKDDVPFDETENTKELEHPIVEADPPVEGAHGVTDEDDDDLW